MKSIKLNRKFCTIIFLFVIGIASIGVAASKQLPVPTMGGKHIWSDVQIHQDWRIQKNAFTGHYRLLDQDDFRITWGSLEDYQNILAQKQISVVAYSEDHLVIFVHGILRSAGSFQYLEKQVRDAGFQTTAISYASTQFTIEEHAKHLNLILDHLENVKHVSFVSHSMGGLVIRQALGQRQIDDDAFAIDKVLMIAPPNQGSQIADQLVDNGLYKFVYGVSGQQLTTNVASDFPNIDVPLGIIAGVSQKSDGYNFWVTGNDDMVVSLEEAHLDGVDAFLEIKGLHSTLLYQEATATAVKQFLQETKF